MGPGQQEPEPTGEQPEPTGEQPQPTGEQPQPTGEEPSTSDPEEMRLSAVDVDSRLPENMDTIEANRTCEKYILSKKYNTMQELENDNDKTIYFDSIYDNTFYSIVNQHAIEKDTMDAKQFFEFLTINLMETMNLSRENALREAKAIVEEKREVLNGDYAVLVDNDSKRNIIFIRKNNVWTMDEQFKDNFYIESNKIFCNSSKDCISIDDKCLSNPGAQKQNLDKDVEKILESFKMQYDISIEDIKGKINRNYDNSISRLKKVISIRKTLLESYNNILLAFDTIHEEVAIVSPYETLRDTILKIKDFSQKQDFIKRFCINYTRGSVNDESQYWLYCIKTGIKLIPLFMFRLANAYINKMDYVKELDLICAEQGTISDDNNYWVDKHSGYIIRNIEFASDEGYDDQGYKQISRDLLENEYTINLEVNEKSSNPVIQTVMNIIKAITGMAGINLSNHREMIINNVLTIQNSSIPSKQQYEKLISKATKKEGKVKAMPSYEDAYNSSLLILTLSFIVFAIQISIPSIKSKKTFPGCIKSFKGYPLGGEQDKTTMVYIACIANKIKSSIKPWNSILKMSESSIIKKMEAIIDKYIIQNKELGEFLTKKREYLLHNENDSIPEEVKLNRWLSFLPPLVDIKISNENILPLAETFKTTLIETYSKGTKNNIMETVQSKIMYYSNSIIEKIQDIVKKNVPLLKNSNDEPFLENSCCNNIKNAIRYFYENDKSILDLNTSIQYYYSLIDSINTLNKAAILYHPINNKRQLPKTDNTFSEETIYKAFIYHCNFSNNLPISEELRSLCLDKPTDFNNDKSIKDIIETLKSEGKIYNFASLVELINIVNRENIVNIKINYPTLNILETLRITLETDNVSINAIDSLLYDKFLNLLDTFDIKRDDNEELRSMKNYLGKTNLLMKQNILEFIKKTPDLSKLDYDNFTKQLDINIDVNNLKFYQNYIFNFLYVFPNIIINKNINYSAIPNHWELSEIHKTDIFNIMKKYYNNLNTFSHVEEFDLVFNIVRNKCSILMKIVNIILYNKPITIANVKSKIYSIFDEKFVDLFYVYVFYSIIVEFINVTENPVFKLEIGNYDNHEPNLLREKIVHYILEFMNIMGNHNNLLHNSYEKVKEKISHAKEKEKDLITDYLKNLTDEEREIESIFKNNKLEKWSKGLQKGLTQYVKENYDEERENLEKQAIKERKLNINSNVTNMNRELYELDNEEENSRQQEIEDEEYDMGNIPDDDDMDSDYEYDNN